MPTPGVRNLIREGKTHQIYSLIQTGAPARHADDGRLAGRPRPRRPRSRWPPPRPRSGQPAELRTPRSRTRRPCPTPVAALMAPRLRPSLQGRRRRRPARRRARSPAPAKDAVTEELASRGLQVMDLDEKKTGLKMELRSLPKRVKAAGADGHDPPAGDHDLLRHDAPARVLRARGAGREQASSRRRSAPSARTSRPASHFSDALAKHPKIFSPLYVAMVRAGETGGVLEESLERIADQLEKDDALRRQVKARDGLPDRRADASRSCVLIGLIAFIVPVFVGRLQGLRRRAAADHASSRSACRNVVTQPVVHPDRRRRRRRRRLQEVAKSELGPPAVGPAPPAHPGQDRQHGPEDRARALVAHVLRALLRRRADHAGDRGDRPDRRQRRGREGDGRRHRVGQVRRLDRRRRSRTPRSSPRWSRR